VAALLFLHIILSPFADETTAEETTAATVAKLGLACGRRRACRRRGRAWPRARAPPPWPSWPRASAAPGCPPSYPAPTGRSRPGGPDRQALARPHPPPRAIDNRLAASRSAPR
jgi:hypothetical protein